MAETKTSDSNQIFSVEMDLTARSLKVSGTRDFIDEQFARFNEMLAVKPRTKKPQTKKSRAVKPRVGKSLTPKRRRGRPRMKPKRANLPPLDLKGTNDIKSLKAYVKGAKLRSNYERCTLYLYYLQRIRSRKTVVHEEISDCFRHLGIKPPANIQVCLSEAKRKYKYVDMPGNGTVKLSTAGANLVEKKLFE
ncbi:hypothetical protein KAU45_08535 [bacterium]|nr:hypothetical protein [bacterium]